LSYVDSLYDREHDRIHVVEPRDGRRIYREYGRITRVIGMDEFGREQQDHELLETILTTVGKTL
jgi:hypothetical protein